MALLFFAFSFSVFAIQSGDTLMYLALARDFIFSSTFQGTSDPYLYARADASLIWQHEYLSYVIFHLLHQFFGAVGLIALKSLVFSTLFTLGLTAEPRAQNKNLLWILLWVLAVLATSFRMIERSSMFSDLLCAVLVWWLLARQKLSNPEKLVLAGFFALWAQLHPGFPLGFAILVLWALHRACLVRTLSPREALLSLMPMAAVLLNPRGLEGALYPFRFALQEAQTLKAHNFEWLSAYQPPFAFSPEVLAFWIFTATCVLLIIKNKLYLDLRGWVAGFALISAAQTVRFIPWACFAALISLKPWMEFKNPRLNRVGVVNTLAALLILIGVKNLTHGYRSSSGERVPQLGFDPKFFPTQTFLFLRQKPIAGRLYNTHDFGSFLIWQKQYPVFHHGFVTDMAFYRDEVVGLLQSPERFFQLARKYNWTMLLIEKSGPYPYFHKILSPDPDWRIVAEDEAAYLIYYLPKSPTKKP